MNALILTATLVLAVPPGQADGPAPPRPPDPQNSRAVRAYRDNAAARVGKAAACELVEKYDEGSVALNNLSVATARRFCAWYKTGNADRIRNFSWILAAIARTRGGTDAGDPVALWIIDEENAGELEKPDRLDAFVRDPLRVSLHIRTAAELAQEFKTSPPDAPWFLSWLPQLPADWQAWAPLAVIICLIAFIAYKRRRQQARSA